MEVNDANRFFFCVVVVVFILFLIISDPRSQGDGKNILFGKIAPNCRRRLPWQQTRVFKNKCFMGN
jgi:hypothetical protein